MIQDISPHVLHNEYKPKKPKQDDYLLYFDQDTMLLHSEGNKVSFPHLHDVKSVSANDLVYLFSVDDASFFLSRSQPDAPAHYQMEPLSILRAATPEHLAFAGITAHHLYMWYRDHRFCGRCAARMQHAEKERMLYCDVCGLMEYPRISPAIIVGIINGDKIVLSKYAGRSYSHYALIAGFAEVGESIEQTVRREVMEEVGLKIKNIKFYKSQPWAFSSSLLLGFFAQLDGSDVITVDGEELSEAGWFSRNEVDAGVSTISLTAEMMRAFRDGYTL